MDRFNYFFFSLLFLMNVAVYTSARLEPKVYIVYMGARKHDDVEELITATHHDMLATVLGSREAAAVSMVYSYKHGFSGFAAMMTKSQAKTFANLPGVVKVVLNFLYKTQTTRTWDYLGLPLHNHSPPNLLHDTNMGDGIIIGVLDTGVTPENEAYNDKGLGPVPSKWKGYCQSGEKFDPKKKCNRKLIGARYFIDGYLAELGQPGNTTGIEDHISPQDGNGHGTHTSSTAAGSPVHNVSYNGLAFGTVRGGAPRARLAMYKVCWEDGSCSAADILKGFDEAIHDGVDVISVSLGQNVPLYSQIDPRDILNFGSFHAVAHGISVVAAGGNEGPYGQTVSGSAPWILTVAASAPDRAFPTQITLGNGQSLTGEALFTGNETGLVNLVYDDPDDDLEFDGYCESLSKNDTWLAGNVVLCFSENGDFVNADDIRATVKEAGDFPSVQVDNIVGSNILLHIRSTRNPRVRIHPTKTQIGKPISSTVSFYSSRGPNTLAPEILKPDIAAPGTNILAAYISEDPAVPNAYDFLSGTSMATPHVAGIVALLKAAHPKWSPSAIKSAIVTTAWTNDPSFGEPIFSEGDTNSKLADAFDYGGGIINPNRAKTPGLVYDMRTTDHLHCLCAMGYNNSAISQLHGQTIHCPKGFSILDVNFPSITIQDLKRSVTLKRTVTNVGPKNSKYRLIVESPRGISVLVKPDTLIFTPNVKKITFVVTISTSYRFNTGYYFGSLTWNDGHHNVRIPISYLSTLYHNNK